MPNLNLTGRLADWILKLPPASTRDLVIERDVKVPTPDGAVLLADHYRPRGDGKPPTILVRSPYGRRGYIGFQYGRPFAERGFQVLIQSVRGTFGSGGEFNPFRNERADGLATLEWLKTQEWFSGDVATLGPSYLGFVQWAIARDAGPMLKAMAPQITASEFSGHNHAGGAGSLDDALFWVYLISTQERPGGQIALFGSDRKLRPIYNHLPVWDMDELAVGSPRRYWREWLEHSDPGDPWWHEVDFSGTAAQVRAPVNMLTGWYDLFLPWQLKDYAALWQAGRNPYLTIGPWTHTSMAAAQAGIIEALAWFKAQLLDDRSGLREAPVRIFMMGAQEWRDLPAWPPASYRPQRWHLQPAGGLAPELPVESPPDRYRYDPADPTPSIGGVLLNGSAGPKDNRALEARPDVLTYTGAVLDRDCEAIGPVSVELYVRSSLEHTDFFARLCDVDPTGKSVNICDGLLRLRPGQPAPEMDGCLCVWIDLWPTAYRFRRGHRIRVQVSSGAHPRFGRNPGHGEPLATTTRLIAADQAVYHDPAHPSAIILPMEA